VLAAILAAEIAALLLLRSGVALYGGLVAWYEALAAQVTSTATAAWAEWVAVFGDAPALPASPWDLSWTTMAAILAGASAVLVYALAFNAEGEAHEQA